MQIQCKICPEKIYLGTEYKYKEVQTDVKVEGLSTQSILSANSVVVVVSDKRAGAQCIVASVRKERSYARHLPTNTKQNTLCAILEVIQNEANPRILNGPETSQW